MVRPDGARTLAGYTLGPRLGSDIYGDLYAGTGEGAREVQVLVVAASMAGDRAFVEHLTRHAAPRLHTFAHRAVVGTVLVARDGRDLVVVTEPAREARSVVDLLAAARGARGGLPPTIIAGIARAVIDGLASAHAAGVVHGAVHPRSVLVERDGTVRLTDLAVGFAAMSAAAAGSELMPLRGLSGFVSPEVALGDPPTAAADVYGIGALMYAMMTGDTPAGPMSTTPALERLVLRALDTDLTRRFASAVELQENFAEALEDDRLVPATAAELASAWADATAALAPKAADGLDAATEDLLASLDGVVEVSRPAGKDTVPPVAVAGRKLRTTASLDAVLFDLDDEPAPPGGTAAAPVVVPVAPPVIAPPVIVPPVIVPVAAPKPAPTPPVAAPKPAPAAPPVAAPKPAPAPPAVAPVPAPTPAPVATPTPAPTPPPVAAPVTPESAPVVATPPTTTPPPAAPASTSSTVLAADRAAEREDEPTRPRTRAADAKPTEPTATEPRPARRAATPAPEVAPVEPPTLKRRLGWLWLVVIALGAGGLAFGLTRQKDQLSAGEKEARERKARAQAEQEDVQRRLQAAKADPGALRVHSNPDNAGVWLLLGRAPFESISLETDRAWELRVELEGYQSKDLRVSARDWEGPEAARQASLTVTLEPGALDQPLPAVPDEPPPGEAAGVPGNGRLKVAATPPGAAVWLLVGVTNTMELSGIEAGRDYELKVTKDGFVPGFVRFGAEEWRAGGDPALPLAAAPKKAVLERTVELVAAPRKGR